MARGKSPWLEKICKIPYSDIRFITNRSRRKIMKTMKKSKNDGPTTPGHKRGNKRCYLRRKGLVPKIELGTLEWAIAGAGLP